LPKGWALTWFDKYSIYTSDYVANGSFASLKDNVKFYKEKNYALLVKTQDFSFNFKKDLTYTDYQGYAFLNKCWLFGGELILSNIGASTGKAYLCYSWNIVVIICCNVYIMEE